jgi:hypothetical protein
MNNGKGFIASKVRKYLKSPPSPPILGGIRLSPKVAEALVKRFRGELKLLNKL